MLDYRTTRLYYTLHTVKYQSFLRKGEKKKKMKNEHRSRRWKRKTNCVLCLVQSFTAKPIRLMKLYLPLYTLKQNKNCFFPSLLISSTPVQKKTPN